MHHRKVRPITGGWSLLNFNSNNVGCDASIKFVLLMRRFFLLCLLLHISLLSFAGKVSGKITDSLGAVLPFSSIQVKNKNIGTTANSEGKYSLALDPGTYTIICQHVGYQKQEKTVEIKEESQTLDFQLAQQQLTLSEVIIKKGEDPAYEIIRQAITKRPVYKDEIKNFTCEVYTKGQLRLRDFPKKFFGQSVDFEDGDTNKRKMIYLSETISKYAIQKPNNSKIEVVASKVSGQSNSFGLSAPQIISFYENNIRVGNLSPRGFVSPIADNALNFYRYKYEGAFFEDGRQINRIKIIPKRKYEPLFSGYINIIEDEWRIYSLDVKLTKESQMEFVDTLNLQQLYIPLQNNTWVLKSQVIYPAIKVFGFDMFGSFVNIYSAYNLNPNFEKGFFDNTILKYTDSSNKKTEAYWETTRPIVLQQEEVADYKKKDSIEKAHKDPRYLDSIDKKRNRLSPTGLLFTGQVISKEKRRMITSLPSIINTVNFNTVEGWNINFEPTLFKRLDTIPISRKNLSITPILRYGFSNGHFNASVAANYLYGKKYFNRFSIAGGKNVFQFNNNNPIRPLDNTISSLLYTKNYMKIYEAWFGTIGFSKGFDNGLSAVITFNYQDRMPLENTTDQKLRRVENRMYTPNYPEELTNHNFSRHQVFATTVDLRWQPGTRYIEFPQEKINIGSKYPVFHISYTQAFKDVLGSDLNYSKWQLSINDNVSLRLLGQLDYNVRFGGFLWKDSVEIPDYKHFAANEIKVSSTKVDGFRLLPTYTASNTASFFTEAHLEYHLNGFLTNKIPVFRKLNWYLVAAANSFYIDDHNYYIEPSIGLENIFKALRIDYVLGYRYGQPNMSGIRIGLGGTLFGRR
ncbi:MAG: hypothetical protein C4330_07860 [Chitinophagaceae bacterium]